ncbi:hypothetical protein AMS68_006731 [Peltaster fructicola]|uniref:Ribosomal protein S21 domain-containing protein n=1 Tax=Peltaster fructicola TaxID=286661 RepID=A0A6H0Y2H3_9PEZI|nr:hypothetical protein AMS68_006731 [Peltaster fructicola]
MDLSKCAQCVMRMTRPNHIAARECNVSFAKRQKTATNGSYSLQHNRMLSSSSSRNADDSQSIPRPDQNEKPSISLSKIFEDAMEPRSKPVQRTTPRPDTSSTANSLMGMLDAFKSRPTSGPLNTIMDSQGRMRRPIPVQLQQAPFKLGPMLGRTIQVDESRGRDVGAAFRMLGALTRRNSIARDSMAQRFHERPGLKRKRLKSQRYRARFKAAFQDMVTRVHTMRKMGW